MTRSEVLEKLALFRHNKQAEYRILRIGIFGSAARDHITDRSDVDVVVELAKPDLFAMVGIKQELEELFQRPVDIVRYREKMNPALQHRIRQEAIYV